MRIFYKLCWFFAAASLLACTPTFNWRQVAMDGSGLSAMLPCKPERAERAVPLTDAGATLHLLSCDAGGVSYALAWARLADGKDAEEALNRWQRAAWASLRQVPAAADAAPLGWRSEALSLPKAQYARQWWGTGANHEGALKQVRQWYFAQQNVVYQAAVYGTALPDEAVTPFVESLRLEAAP